MSFEMLPTPPSYAKTYKAIFYLCYVLHMLKVTEMKTDYLIAGCARRKYKF